MLSCVVVDDSPFVRKLLSDSIVRLGHAVTHSYGSGLEFLEDIDTIEYDVIFLDIILPNITGIDVLKKILEFKADSKVIVLSGLAQNSVITTCLHLGAMDFILKPFEEEKLRDILLVLSSTINPLSGESLSNIELASHIVNLYLQEIITLSTTIIRKVLQSQIVSILESYKNSYTNMLQVDPLKYTILIDDDFWGKIY